MSKIIGVTVGTNLNPENFGGGSATMPEITANSTTDGTWIAVNGEDICFIPNGRDGEDGVGIYSVERTSGNGSAGTTDTYTITYTDGRTETFTVYNGKNGSKGSDGVGIKSVVQTITSNVDAGSNVITVTKTDNTTSTFTVKNGSKGTPGKTPIKGEDYYTDADKAEIVAELVDATPVKSVNGKTGVVSLSANDVGARSSTWMPTYTDVGAEKSGTANTAVSTHNTNTDAHNDIRLLIAGLSSRLDALANSDDETLDQMAEVVAYIKDNRNLIEQITTGKVSVADIVDNLTTNVSNKPLSASQGVALKKLIDAIVVPTKVSAFDNDKGYLTSFTETDPTVPTWAKASSKPSYTKTEVGLGNVDNVKQYSASNPPPYPVTSVNGKTGAVTVSVPTKTSQLTNDSGYLTEHQDISGKADKSSAEIWTFTLKSGGTVTKKVVLA
jgi:hypothetical protein